MIFPIPIWYSNRYRNLSLSIPSYIIILFHIINFNCFFKLSGIVGLWLYSQLSISGINFRLGELILSLLPCPAGKNAKKVTLEELVFVESAFNM